EGRGPDRGLRTGGWNRSIWSLLVGSPPAFGDCLPSPGLQLRIGCQIVEPDFERAQIFRAGDLAPQSADERVDAIPGARSRSVYPGIPQGAVNLQPGGQNFVEIFRIAATRFHNCPPSLKPPQDATVRFVKTGRQAIPLLDSFADFCQALIHVNAAF